MYRGKHLDAQLGLRHNGVLCGLEGPIPGSGLDWDYLPGLVRVKGDNAVGYTEHLIAADTLTVTASYDTYVYIDGTTKLLASYGVANGGLKPKIGKDIAAKSEFIAKIVSDASDITAVEDLREFAGFDVVAFQVPSSFEATGLLQADFHLPFNGRVVALDGIVAEGLAGTDAGTVTPSLITMDGTVTAITGAALSFAASSAAGVRDLEVASGDNYFKTGDRIRVLSAKSTAGGTAMVSVICERL
ncbi:MAG: hypothetical protein AMS20_00260 [Gemmatimonas sp. SG8_28]|nr:MAG: hypothetical protein AMS20_00260 [Gemmatimonas sp. SG8_28]